MTSSSDYANFCKHHETQLVMSGVPSKFWPTLHEKLSKEKFDSGEHFSMIFQSDGDEDDKFHQHETSLSDNFNNLEHDQGGQSDVTRSKCGSISGSGCQRSKWKVIVSNQAGVSASDGSKIFLIDHAWTFNPYDARKHLNHVPGLLTRMTALVDLDEDSVVSTSRDELLELVLNRIWRYNQTYTVNKDDLALEEKLSTWYVMDEFGSRIRHHDQPNFRVVPFYYAPQQMLYSLLFPISDCDFGDEVTRDFVEGTMYHKADWRDFYLYPWYPRLMVHIPVEFSQPRDDYFQAYEHIPITDIAANGQKNGQKVKQLKIYAESNQITKYLKHPSFSVVENPDEADILWLQSHFKDWKNLVSTKPHVFVNQFPYESVLTVKDLLAACIHLAYNDIPMNPATMEFQPAWFCTTFNLRTELPQFVSYYQKREERDLDNTWIIKPWNLARSLDTFVTNDLKQIIRLIDSGPKIACKYIDDPVLFHRSDINEWVKFDLRFIVFLRSVQPLKVYVYDRFWLRFALKPFSLDTFDDFEKHFTVFNYLDKEKILQMRCEKFVEQFSEQYPGQEWKEALRSTYQAIKETFETACKFPPPKGLAPLPQCRAMYGIDTMLKWSLDEKTGEKIMQPVVLEVNFMPDCLRACDYYPDFADTVFQTLFLDDVPADLPVTLL